MKSRYESDFGGGSVLFLIAGIIFSLCLYAWFVYLPSNNVGNNIQMRLTAENLSSTGYLGLYLVKNKYAKVRVGPGKNFELMRKVPQDVMIRIFEKRGKWLKTNRGNWIHENDLLEL